MDRAGAWTNTGHVYDSIGFIAIPKRLDKAVIASKYIAGNQTAAQIAENIGASKQMVLARLRAAGISDTKGRGRSPENYRFLRSAPFGKKVLDGRLVTNSVELKIARIIVELRDRKSFSWNQVCQQLNEKGHKTRRNTPWKESNIRHIYKLWSGKL